MSDLADIVEAIEYASSSTTDNKERQFLETMKNYLSTDNSRYLQDLQRMYNNMGYSSKARMEQFYQAIQQYNDSY